MAEMQAWKGYVSEYMQGEQGTSVNNLVRELRTKNATLLELVEELGPHLTSEDKHMRCGGTQLLSEVLHRLPRLYLSEKEVEVMVEFYCNRMNDHFTVAPHVIYGMVALSLQPKLSDDAVIKISRSVFEQVTVQSMQQSVRQNVYVLFMNYLERKLEALKSIGDEFLLGYIQAMDGEKDPRCLVLAFRSMEIISLNFNITTYAEEIFEVVACYFPIDFTPPPNDAKRVSREDLILSLRRCLSASPKFAEFCFPLLMEKITSSIPSAKLDAFLTLAAAVEVYGADALDEFLIALWSEIRREVFSPSSEDLEVAALSALSAMVLTLSKKEPNKPLKTFCDGVFKDCRRHLTDPEMQLVYPCAKLLQATVAACPEASNIITSLLIPLLLEQFHKLAQVEQRKVVLDVLCDFIRITVSRSKESYPVKQQKNQIHPLVMSLLLDKSPILRSHAVQIADVLLRVPAFYEEAEKSVLAEHLGNILLTETNSVVREKTIDTIKTFSNENKSVVRDVVIPRLLQNVQEGIHSANGELPADQHKDEKFALVALAQIACDAQLIETVAPCLLNHIETLTTYSYKDELLKKSLGLCKCLKSILLCDFSKSDIDDFLRRQVLHRIFVLTIRGALYEGTDSLLTRWELVKALAPCVRLIMQKIGKSEEIVANTVGKFLMGDISFLGDDINKNPISFQPLQVTSPSYQTQLSYLLSAVVCSVDKDVRIPDLSSLLSHLQELACKSSHPPSASSAAKCFAGILNKLDQDSNVTQITELTCQQLQQTMIDSSAETHLICQSLTLWSWISKALVLRGHPLQESLISKLLEYLKHPILAGTAAEGFSVILDEYDDVMTSSMHANIRLMYKQRFFLQTAPLLVEGFKVAHETQSAFYLTALSHMLKHLPKQVMGTELPPLLPLLIRSLTCGQVDLQISTVTTLTTLLVDQPKLLASYVDDIIPSLLQLTTYKPSMLARSSALKCLGMLTTLPKELVLPQQKRVIRALKAPLDDHKRLVRREAVEAVTQWHLLSS